MDIITLLGIDLAKNSFYIYGVNSKNRRIVSKPLKRNAFFESVLKLKPEVIAMEACGSSHFWAAKFESFGIPVKIIPAQFVKPFVKTNKSDKADAEAIVMAALHPDCRTVPIKGSWHLDMQSLHKDREMLIKSRTALCNHLRSLFYERGRVTKVGRNKLIDFAKLAVDDPDLSYLTRQIINRNLKQYSHLQEQLNEIEQQLKTLADENPDCKRLQDIPGIGPITATALVSAVPDKHHFKNGRHFAAWIGLVPRHSGTGGRTRILGVSKRGNPELRRLLIQGANSLLIWAAKKEDSISKWITDVKKRRGGNKAKVAMANKTARIAYNVLCRNELYRAA